MDIRPVDVQMLINKSSQTNRNEDLNQQQFDRNLAFFQEFKKELQTDSKRTIESDKSNQTNINKDGKNMSSDKNKRGKKEKKEEEKKKTSKNESLSFLDISI